MIKFYKLKGTEIIQVKNADTSEVLAFIGKIDETLYQEIISAGSNTPAQENDADRNYWMVMLRDGTIIKIFEFLDTAKNYCKENL